MGFDTRSVAQAFIEDCVFAHHRHVRPLGLSVTIWRCPALSRRDAQGQRFRTRWCEARSMSRTSESWRARVRMWGREVIELEQIIRYFSRRKRSDPVARGILENGWTNPVRLFTSWTALEVCSLGSGATYLLNNLAGNQLPLSLASWSPRRNLVVGYLRPKIGAYDNLSSDYLSCLWSKACWDITLKLVFNVSIVSITTLVLAASCDSRGKT